MTDKKDSQNEKLIDTKGDETPGETKPAAKQERTKEDKDRSFSFCLGYAKRECGSIMIGMLFLVLGCSGELALPAFIGIVLDLL